MECVSQKEGRDGGNRGMAWRRGRAVSGRNVPQFAKEHRELYWLIMNMAAKDSLVLG